MTQTEWQVRISDLERNSRRYPPWELLDNLATETESVSTWKDFQKWLGQFHGAWCFRGHRRANWFLIPSLERQRMLVTVKVEDRIHQTYQPFDSRVHEQLLLERFIRSEPTHKDDPLQWMQHYGAPTTLMDWT